jgi:hypothetical protein
MAWWVGDVPSLPGDIDNPDPFCGSRSPQVLLGHRIVLAGLRCEGEQVLRHKAGRHVVAHDPITIGPLAVGVHRRAEEVVEKGEVGGVVAIDGFTWLKTAWKPTMTT